MFMKSFISYSSKDNIRFVEKFVDKLRDSGIEVWKDTLETIDVDLTNIIKEIYKSDIFIVIISKYSVKSNWVNEEIKVAMKRKIEENLRIFPVVLAEDDVDVPIILNHLIHYYIEDINDYDDKFEELIEDIFILSKKTPLGNVPLYYCSLSILEEQEINIFKSIGDYLFKQQEYYGEVYPNDLIRICNYDEDEISFSLNILRNEDLIIDTGHQEGFDFNSHSFTSKGIYMYFKNFISDYKEIFKKIIGSILKGNSSLDELFKDTQVDKNFIHSIILIFRDNGLINCDMRLNIYEITPVGHNYFKNVLQLNNQ